MQQTELVLKQLLGLKEDSKLDGEQNLFDSELMDSFAFYQVSSYLLKTGRIASVRELQHCIRVADLLPYFEDVSKTSQS